ncbi:MAG TPA: protein kinase [Vicinamibacterales bacterium]|nr:protein kinase [Vicinamibacterales bacterium]
MRHTAESAAAPLVVGAEVNGRYVIEAVLGAGGMGRVYRVRDGLYPQRPTALKTVLTTVDARSAELFREEFWAMATLGHPGIARVYDFERLAGSTEFFFTMELVSGRDIAHATDVRDWRRTARLLAQVAQALDYIHRHDVIHLDLKPSNVMVKGHGPDEAVKVLDFGIAGMKHASGVVGTLHYIAPEVVNGGVPDGRADIYALGVMAVELLTGRRPYRDVEPQRLFGCKSTVPIRLDERGDSALPAWLAAAVERMCAIAPDQRFANAMDVARCLEAGEDIDVRPRPSPPATVVAMSQFVGRATQLRTVLGHVRARLQSPAGAAPMPCLFVSGPRGCGKSRLLREVRHHLQLDGLVVLTGDSFADDLAEYRAIAAIVLAAARLAEANGWTDLVALHGPEVVKMAPGFGGSTMRASTAFANAHAERRRLVRAAADFLLELSTRIGLVLYFGDLHWASRGTIDVLATLVARLAVHERARVAIVGTYRSDGVSGTPLEALLFQRGIAAAAVDLPIPLLELTDTEALAVSMLGCAVAPELVHQLYAASNGTPFLLEHAVRSVVAARGLVARDGVLHLDAAHAVAFGAMTARGAVVNNLSRLDATDMRLVQLLAACGRPIATTTLARAATLDAAAVTERLHSLEERQLAVMLPGDQSTCGLSSDSIREAVLSSCDAESRSDLHQHLASAYDATLSADDAGEHLLETAAQWMAAAAPRTPAEGVARAAIAIRAARAAHGAAAFSQALRYLDAASRWLPMSKWHDYREVALAWEEQQAAACIAEDRLDEAEAAGLRIEQYATDPIQRASGRRIWMTCQLRRGHLQSVIESGIGLARDLGGRLPRRPHIGHAVAAIASVRRRLTPAVLARIDQLPPMSDPRALEFDRCFEALYLAAYLGEPKLLPVVIDAAVRLMLTHGLSPSSALIVGSSSMLMVAAGDFDRAFAMAKAADTLLPLSHRESHGVARYAYSGGIRHLRDRFDDIRRDMTVIRDECLDVGDYVFAGMACISIMSFDVLAGAPLDATERFLREPQTGRLVESSVLTRRLQRIVHDSIRQLRGAREERESLGRPSPDDDQLSRSARRYYQLIVNATYREPPATAARFVTVPLTIERMWAGTPYVVETFVSWILCAINGARRGLPWWRRAVFPAEIGLIMRRLRAIATRSPENHGYRLALAEAEWARYTGRRTDAALSYARTIAQADAAGNLRLGGLARDLLGELRLEEGNRAEAVKWAKEARDRYRLWQADGVVDALEARYARAGVSLGS